MIKILDQLKEKLQKLLDYFQGKDLVPVVEAETQPVPPPVVPPVVAPKYEWSTPEKVRKSFRMICDEEGMTVEQKNLMCQVIHCESGFNPQCVHPNLVDGKVSSVDYSTFQINSYWHIGKGKDFPSVEYVMTHQEEVARWMCKMVKAGKLNLWVCFSGGFFKNYTP